MNQQRTVLGHPIGLFVLFFAEMWERFSYYGMRAILVLFITASTIDGGLGWTQGEALALYGWYTMFVYVMSIPGGILADRLLGQKKAVMLGGFLLVAGHGIMAIPETWAFYTALVLIILGVGALKPNISTMVGGLYKQGDTRRDKGFTIFYMGINLGAFLAGILVAEVARAYGWHYGFGLAGIGMLLGQIVFVGGQKYLKGIGDYNPPEKESSEQGAKNKPLTKIEKDRIIVLLISFLIVIVFWGAFEQAGGLMNLYANYKTDRFIDSLNLTISAGSFQSLNSLYILLFGIPVAGYWAMKQLKGKESSTLLKMAVGTIIMGIGFFFMSAASMENEMAESGKSMMLWLFLAYLFHTIGELCISPTALSFITKLAPLRYASIMMGVYFAATGFGNKVAGTLGELAQSEPIKVEIKESALKTIAPKVSPENYGYFVSDVNVSTGKLMLEDAPIDMLFFLEFSNDTGKKEFMSIVNDYAEENNNKLGIVFMLNGSGESGSDQLYQGSILVEQAQNSQEFKIFTIIAIGAIAFGLLLLVFFKKLKKLTHNAEDLDDSIIEKKTPIQTTHGEVMEN